MYAELTKYSGEHLLHEFTMFWWLSGAVSYMEGYMQDALLESWVVHLRNLINFFCRPGAPGSRRLLALTRGILVFQARAM